MQEVEFRLPWPPSVNTYWRSRVATVRGRQMPIVYVSKEGRAYQREVRRLIGERWSALEPYAGRVGMLVVMHQPTRIKTDLDNRLKALLDSLTAAGVWLDDSQVDSITCVRGNVGKPGGLDVRLSILPAGADSEILLKFAKKSLG